ELARAETELAAARARGPSLEPIAPTPRSLDELAADLLALRTNEQAALQSWSSTHAEALEIASLLAAGICPRCHQSVAPTEFRAHQAEADSAAREAEGTLARIRGQVGELEAERAARERFERDRHSWIAQEELRTAAALAVDRARRRREEGASTLGRLRSEWEAASVDLSHAREDVAPLQDGANLLAHAERRREEARISVVEGERAEALRQSLRDAAEAARAQVELETDRFRELDERRTDLRSRRVALEEALRGAEEGDRAHAELLARRDAARALELETHAGLSTAEDRVRAAEALRVKAAAGAEERRHHVGTAETLARVAAFLNPTFRDALLDLERRLLGRAQAMFERTFSRSFSALVEDPGLLARCGPSFVPYAEIDGEYTPAEALSGGERTALALAFRLALGEVVRSTSRLRLDTIILDEPTDGFSPEQVGRMGELFESLPWGQVIVVTHEVGLGAIADRAVRVRKTAGGSVLEGAGVAESVERAPAPPTRRRRRTGALPMGVPSAK
ncbi:MAG TPA: hypothetical protein VJQ43_05840, partial [Thermoplasmata archaeon]|nr:hypothetical protein [Thermoplasmata archaeon]